MKTKISSYISPHADFCSGAFLPDSAAYVTGPLIQYGSAKKTGYQLLDKTLAYDKAESSNIYIGQINMIHVSSFCGPHGVLWGYDIEQSNLLRDRKLFDVNQIPVFDGTHLQYSLKNLFGTEQKRNFPLFPGSLVPCAYKDIYGEGGQTIMGALAIGIPADRKQSACVYVENLAIADGKISAENISAFAQETASSVLKVGVNQSIRYKEIFLLLKAHKIEEGMVGCMLVACPYFLLAGKAAKRYSKWRPE